MCAKDRIHLKLVMLLFEVENSSETCCRHYMRHVEDEGGFLGRRDLRRMALRKRANSSSKLLRTH